MDDDEFEDLLGEAELLQDPSCVSLTGAAANLSFGVEADNPYRTKTTSENAATDHETRRDSIIKSDRSADESDGFGLYSRAVRREPARSNIYPNSDIIHKIEAAFEEMSDALLNDKDEIGITLKTCRSQARGLGDTVEGPTRRLCFPGKTADEAWRFAVVMRILELMHEALRNDIVLSKRDIYYRDTALFGSQTHVDRYVDDIAFTFGVPRSSLNITAVAKGLVAGAITFCRRDGTMTNAATDREGMLVPNLKDMLSINMKAVKWILVIEKEASFRSIASSSFWDTVSTRGVIITGKGYPDLNSRALLRFLSTASPQNGFASPPVYGLADFDPDGLAILDTYRHGSKALAHENEHHRVSQLQWLGLRSEHLMLGAKDCQASQGLLTLTTRDRKKATKMLEQVHASDHDEAQTLRKNELQTMLMLNTKAELQLLDAIPNGMMNLLESELGKL